MTRYSKLETLSQGSRLKLRICLRFGSIVGNAFHWLPYGFLSLYFEQGYEVTGLLMMCWDVYVKMQHWTTTSFLWCIRFIRQYQLLIEFYHPVIHLGHQAWFCEFFEYVTKYIFKIFVEIAWKNIFGRNSYLFCLCTDISCDYGPWLFGYNYSVSSHEKMLTSLIM